LIRLLFSISLHFSNALIALELSQGSQIASVYFISPSHQESVSGEVRVIFGLMNFGVSPAGIDVIGTGHHHLIIDAQLPAMNQPITSDENHVHFGKGQTEVRLDLEPGPHTLQLLLGDYRHIPHSPPIYSRKITIVVK